MPRIWIVVNNRSVAGRRIVYLIIFILVSRVKKHFVILHLMIHYVCTFIYILSIIIGTSII